MIFFFVVSGIICAQAPTQPILPQNTMSVTLPMQGTLPCPTLTSGSNCIRNIPSGNATSFQNAVNASTCGDTIVLAAGSTYSGNFTIPPTSCSGWIEIVSNALTSLPPSGNRVGPSNSAYMAKISTPNSLPAIQFLPNSNHWRLVGLEITTSYVSTVNMVYNIVSAGLKADVSTSISVQSQLPASLIFDRIYVHGLPNANTIRGIQMDSQGIAIVDSYCDEIHANGNDSQCFASWNGAGPYLIQNSFIQAGAENIMFGGADPSIASLVPSDITIVGNLIQKNLAWEGEAAPFNWVIKNLFELKNAQRVLLDGNVIQYTWSAAQEEALIIRSVNQGGACSWCVVQDVTITHNLIRHAPIGIVFAPCAGPLSTNSCVATGRILVQNNVLDDISAANWGGHGWVFQISVDPGPPYMHDLTIDHNTAFPDTNFPTDYPAFMFIGDTARVLNTQVTNNISNYSEGGIVGNGVGSGTVALNTYATGYIYNDMVFINSSGTSTGTYPSGTLWNTQSGVQFTNFPSANYQLLSGSPYHNAGTDGKDIGVWDWVCLNYDSAGALAGEFVPSSGCGTTTGGLVLQPPVNLTAIVQ